MKRCQYCFTGPALKPQYLSPFPHLSESMQLVSDSIIKTALIRSRVKGNGRKGSVKALKAKAL